MTIYTKTGCPYCSAAKNDLEKRGIPFTEINVSVHQGRLAEMKALSGGLAVPVLVRAGKVTVGFGGT
ncbi:MAG: glutaredoxin family protein [Firmicutes bacterium]|nr:glutaredoxin family protein [Bacillota bacterium]